MKESITYYITSKEFVEKQDRVFEKRIRLGGFVESLTKNIATLEYFFELSDGGRMFKFFSGEFLQTCSLEAEELLLEDAGIKIGKYLKQKKLWLSTERITALQK